MLDFFGFLALPFNLGLRKFEQSVANVLVIKKAKEKWKQRRKRRRTKGSWSSSADDENGEKLNGKREQKLNKIQKKEIEGVGEGRRSRQMKRWLNVNGKKHCLHSVCKKKDE